MAKTNTGSVYKFYKIDGDKVTRSKKDCPRCGKGVFMAEHKDRLSCGKCGFTEFSKKDNTKSGSRRDYLHIIVKSCIPKVIEVQILPVSPTLAIWDIL